MAKNSELDFNQAMSDFGGMFPSLDAEVIEAVLRTNKGDVDATVDQLLGMTIDDTAVKTVAFEQPPPSYENSVRGGYGTSSKASKAGGKSIDLPDDFLRLDGDSTSKNKTSQKAISSTTHPHSSSSKGAEVPFECRFKNAHVI